MHLSVFGQLGHLERLDSIFYFLKASENQLTHSETKYFEQHKVEKILFICKMCLNLNCNRKVFENWNWKCHGRSVAEQMECVKRKLLKGK